jgi:hypothetical protein
MYRGGDGCYRPVVLSPLLRQALLPSVLVCALAGALGCASTSTRYAEQAVYEPSVRGYVLTPPEGPDPDAEDGRRFLLGDPLTLAKLRCREELEPWVALHRGLREDSIHDENVAVGSLAGLFPFAATGSVVVILGIIVASPTFIPMAAASSDGGWELYERGLEHFSQKRYPEAASDLERAVAKSDEHVAVRSPAAYYLGVAYAQTGRPDQAKHAFEAFVERSTYADAALYDSAEAWLSYYGAAPKPCASTEPVRMEWAR